MRRVLLMEKILSILFFSLIAISAQASRCGDLVYNKTGMLRKYEIINLTLIEAIKKHGTSSTSGATTESSTAISDPGVTTGASVSWGQSLSTRGECKWGGIFASQENYHNYIAQNMDEIKKEMALGQGGHLELLASVHECDANGRTAFPKTMQKHLVEFIDYRPEQSQQFGSSLEKVISKDLTQVCQWRA